MKSYFLMYCMLVSYAYASDPIPSTGVNPDFLFSQPIHSLKQVKHHAKKLLTQEVPPEKILVAFDWDNTLSKNNGETLPLREDEVTKNVIHWLEKKRIPFFILTSRLQGAPITYKECFLGENFLKVIGNVEDMKKALDITFPDIFKSDPYDDEIVEFNDKDILFTQYNYESYYETSAYAWIQQGGVVFGGHPEKSKKGHILKNLIEENKLKSTPEHVIFVDNDKEHTEAVLKSLGKLFKKTATSTVKVFLFPEELPLMASQD